MLARSLIVLLALELALYLLIGAWAASALGWSIGPCVLLALSIASALRLLLVGFSFALAHRFRGARPPDVQLGLRQALALFVGEFLAFAVLFVWLQPLVRWFAAPRVASRSRRIPIVFVPGIYCNRAVWWWLSRRLRARGLDDLIAVTLEPPLADIDVLAADLARRIEDLCQQRQASQVVLVGHSMGGLVARAYLRDAGPARIARLITLASPHHGSVLACLGVGPAAAQLRPGSAWLRNLNADEDRISAVPIVSMFSWHDNFVAPQDSAILAQATNVGFAGIGHLALLFSETVAQRLYDEIQK
ncbi:MAG TPA: alpha/beta fold hydrolase [Burkholderiales bacterium]|nr:alpha/beta fold hydrolase [Burkholderiales bacterium]